MACVRNSYLVKPAKQTPNGDMCVSDCDQEKPITHAPLVYFYRPSQAFPFTSVVETLKISLSQVLVHFYPLAGRLYSIDGGRVRLECCSAGAMFYEAESNAKIEDFKDFAPTLELRRLIPSVDYSGALYELPLLLVQLTEFRCGGFSLGIAISHIMADGKSLSHFMSEWSRIARGEPLGYPPFLDRSVLLAADPPPPPRFNHDRFDPLPLLMGKLDNQEERSKESTVTMLHLSRNQVHKLQEMANENRAANVRAYTRYEAVAGHMWRCACKAREHKYEQQTKVAVPVSYRGRVPLPKAYFGNAVLRETASSLSGELMTKPLAYASSRIREPVEKVTYDYVKSTLDLVKRQPDLNRFRTFHTVGSTQGAFYGNPNMEITSWIGISLQGTDFGWGKEIHMGPGSLNFDGKSFIFHGRDEEGSLTVALRFQVSHTKKFIKFFYEDINKNVQLSQSRM